MTEKKREILEKSFALFLKKGYSAVSITDIQKEVGLGRASLYHYFESKEDLLKQVVETIFVEFADKSIVKGYESLTLKNFIKIRIKTANELVNDFEKLTGTQIGTFNFYLLFFNAIEIFPEFVSGIVKNILQNKELLQWKTVIQNSINKGEVRKDINVELTARTFVAIEDGIGITQVLFFNKEKYSTDLIQEAQENLLALISI